MISTDETDPPVELIVRWIPLLTMDWKWEAAWRETLQNLSSPKAPIRLFKDGVDTDSHVHFIAYEAKWHKTVKQDSSIQSAIAAYPPSDYAKIILVVCDQVARPKVTENQVERLSVQTLSNVGSRRHISRAYTREILMRDTENFVRQSMYDHGMARVDGQISGDLYQQATEPTDRGNEIWDATYI